MRQIDRPEDQPTLAPPIRPPVAPKPIPGRPNWFMQDGQPRYVEPAKPPPVIVA